MAVDPIDHAYALAVAVLGDTDQAEEVALTATRRGGRSPIDVLAHARELLAASRVAPADDGDGIPHDLTSLARALTRRRPVDERVVVDLDGRHGLDRAQLGRVLDVPPAEAAVLSSRVADEWRANLDPALFAYLNRECLVLDPEPETVAELLDGRAAVTEHIAACEACTDRARAMVTVRDLVTAAPLERAPAQARFSARGTRFRRSAPLAGDERPDRATRAWRIGFAAAAVVVVLAVVAVVEGDDGGGGVPARPANALQAFPPLLTRTPLPPVQLHNTSDTAIVWRSEPDAPWIVVSPRRGRLEPRTSETIQLALRPDTPEGDVSGGVAFVGHDGDTGLVRIDVAVERPPDVDASATGCRIEATVEDESEIARVVLNQVVGGATSERAMAPLADGYAARLTPSASQWWVTAVDARGNQASTAPLPSDC